MEDTHPFAKLELTPSELGWLKEALTAIKLSLSADSLTELMHSAIVDEELSDHELLFYTAIEVPGAVTKLTSLHVREFVKRQRMDLEVRMTLVNRTDESSSREAFTKMYDSLLAPFPARVDLPDPPKTFIVTRIQLYYRHAI